MLKKLLKKVFPGVSWSNPLLNAVFHAMDPLDYIVRSAHGLSYLPPYSIRVRSNGVTKQFGGQNFFVFGNLLADLLKKYASLNNDSKVLEIGCGCGRTAVALSKILDNGNYVGMDIEKIALESCLRRPIFVRKRFSFDYLDVQNNEYNPEGEYGANTYKFPYGDNRFDVIFLVSVFTHMLTDDVKNYIKEISRMLKPGGICMVTTFLMDKGRKTKGLSFPYCDDDHYYYNHSLPEVAVGYYLKFYVNKFASSGMKQEHEILWGSWRNNSKFPSSTSFSQDILFFSKEE
jgi:ubiquinone/menaquinone biosynthesis C-methylase UbiE